VHRAAGAFRLAGEHAIDGGGKVVMPRARDGEDGMVTRERGEHRRPVLRFDAGDDLGHDPVARGCIGRRGALPIPVPFRFLDPLARHVDAMEHDHQHHRHGQHELDHPEYHAARPRRAEHDTHHHGNGDRDHDKQDHGEQPFLPEILARRSAVGSSLAASRPPDGTRPGHQLHQDPSHAHDREARGGEILGRFLDGVEYSFWSSSNTLSSLVDKVHKEAIAKHKLIQNIAGDLANQLLGDGLKTFLLKSGGLWTTSTNRKIAEFFEKAVRSLKDFLPIGLYLKGTLASTLTNLGAALGSLNIPLGSVIARIQGPNVALTSEGTLILQKCLDQCKALLSPYFTAGGIKIGRMLFDSTSSSHERTKVLQNLLVKAWAAGDWVSQIPGISSFTYESPLLQFRRDAFADNFINDWKYGNDGFIYARIKWQPAHEDGMGREFIVRFKPEGSLYRNGFEVFAAWTPTAIPGVATANHFYSTIPSAQMSTVWDSIGTSTFDPADFGRIQASQSGTNAPWLLDLVDPPNPLPPGYPRVIP
jgi:hypothetical protein